MNSTHHASIRQVKPPSNPAAASDGLEAAVPIAHGQPGLSDQVIALVRMRVRHRNIAESRVSYAN